MKRWRFVAGLSTAAVVIFIASVVAVALSTGVRG